MAKVFKSMDDLQRRYFPENVHERLTAKLEKNNLNEIENISDESPARGNKKDYLAGIFKFRWGSAYGLLRGDTRRIIDVLESFYTREGHKILAKVEDSFEFLKKGTKNKKYAVSLFPKDDNLTIIVGNSLF